MDWPSGRLDISPMDDIGSANAVLTCQGLVQISLDQNGRAPLTAQMLLTDRFPNYGRFKVYVNETGRNYLDCSDLGKTRSATVLDTTNGMSCWSMLKVEDKLPPEVLCTVDTLPCQTDPYLYDYTGFIRSRDNCDLALEIRYSFRFEKLFCHPLLTGISYVDYTVVDDHGNSSTCSSQIFFRKAGLDQVVFPADDTLYCPAFDISQSGEPTVLGQPVEALCDLFVSANVDTIPVCGGMVKLQRRWFVTDWCTRTMRTDTQYIIVADTLAPELVCPPNLSLYAKPDACLADWRIPALAATDLCSPQSSLLYYVRIDSHYLRRPGDLVGLEVGKHTVEYIALDPCGNADTCSASVHILDRTPPTLICPPNLVLALDGSGQTTLNSDYFRRIGYFFDNCGIDDVLIRRMTSRCGFPADTSFGHSIRFCCADAGLMEMIAIKVTDESGNANFCMINIEIQNKNVVNILCPANITLSCTQDRMNLDLTGRLGLSGVCIDTTTNGITYVDSGTLDSCYQGIIVRKWRVEFVNGSIDTSCRQQIRVINNYVFSSRSIIWARDTTVSGCKSFHPDSIMSRPSIPSDSCHTVQFSWRDSMPVRHPDSCQRVLRLWFARSTCTGMSARDTQVIDLANFRAPRLKGPRDTLYCSKTDSCNPFLVLQALTVTSCNTGLTIVNDYNGNGANASDVYPLGRTRVIFTVTDACGNISRDTVNIELVDKISPQVNCRRILREIEVFDSARIVARDLLESFSDNCTRNENIRITFDQFNMNDSVRYISCAQHRQYPDSIWRFQVYVIDESGNKAVCIGLVDVDDPNNFCNSLQGGTTVLVTGLVKNTNGNPMEQVELMGQDQTILTETDHLGQFRLGQITSGNSVFLKPGYSAGDWLDGVTTQDILYIQKHILGIDPFRNPEQWIAADVDRDGRVSSRDLIWIRKLILGIETEVPGNSAWRFIRADYRFKDPAQPLLESPEECFNTQSIDRDQVVNFLSIKTGDVSGTSGYQENVAEARLRHIEFRTEDHVLSEGMKNHSDFIINDDLTMEGYQFVLTFDPNLATIDRLVDFTNAANGLEMDKSMYHIQGNRLVVSYTGSYPKRLTKGQMVLRIVWSVKQSGNLKDLLRETDYRNNEIYTTNSMAAPLYLRLMNGLIAEPEIKNWKIAPNPFRDRLCIQFESTVGMDCRLEIRDLAGRTVWDEWRSVERGANSWCVETQTLSLPQGIYLYRFSTGQIEKKGKLVKGRD